MPKLIYCTYLTVYTGSKLPPFYLGSTSVDNISKGYRGSVASKNYKSIWKQELSDHPDLFKTIILTRHETRQEAMEREILFQEAFTVARNPMYINMAHANGKFFTSGPHSPETKAKIAVAKTGKIISPETRAKQSTANTGKKRTPETIAKMTGKKQSPETIAKRIAANTGQKHTPETRAKQSAAHTGKKMSPESIAKTVAAKIGKKQSPETIAKRVAARLETLSKKKPLI